MLSLRSFAVLTARLAAPLVVPFAVGFAVLGSAHSFAQTTHIVTLQGTSFTPASLTIAVGDTVQWDWVSGFHNVVSGPPDVADGIFSSGPPVFPPMSFSVTFDQAFLDAHPVPGKRYDYFCDVHVAFGMVASVTVDVPASGTSRNAGTNPASLVLVQVPQIGGNFIATQDLSSSGHSLGVLLGFAGALNVPLPGGQTLLMDVFDPAGELLVQPLMVGPLINWNLAIPNDSALCGFSLSVQGVHVGGVQPFALSNALDLVVGT